MAKVQSFADKANKKKQGDLIVMCPDTGKETKIVNVRLVDAIPNGKGSFRFLDRNQRDYESTYKPYKG